jgi:large-conductance mechanosensitive channel
MLKEFREFAMKGNVVDMSIEDATYDKIKEAIVAKQK